MRPIRFSSELTKSEAIRTVAQISEIRRKAIEDRLHSDPEPVCSDILRRRRLDRKGVDVRLHDGPQRGENGPVPLDPGHPGELSRYDHDTEVTLACPGAFMTLVQMTLIDDVEELGIKGGLKRRPDGVNAGCSHGRTFRNGLTSTRS